MTFVSTPEPEFAPRMYDFLKYFIFYILKGLVASSLVRSFPVEEEVV